MTLTIGEIKIDLINESTIMADAGGPFGLVPYPLWSRYYDHDERYRVPMHHLNLLVRTGGKTVIIDTGNGMEVSENRAAIMALEHPGGGLVAELAARGVEPGDVDLVINTHLHADHCSTNTQPGEDGGRVPTFPNAEYVTQRREYKDAMFPNERTQATYLAPNFQPLVESGQMRLLQGDVEIIPGIRGVVTPGHTPGHMSIIFESGGEAGMFVADLASMSINFAKLAWMTSYDVEPLVTLETKRKWQRWALDHNALLIFQHDPQTYAGRLVMEGGKTRIEPVVQPEKEST